ncbi:checkpoint protein HUS1-like [Corticium candelabrum]|uniref:checkpoint protein HUS1-like n=1 Tax=Corticium candelabrum TaxID=121492 RepID=UPI002E2692F9|nr:checkpoint protein HUS1-like [Corticium candelabrum]
MRFRAKLLDIQCILQFSRVAATVAKLSKACVLRLTPLKVCFACIDRAASGGMRVWCELEQGNFFDDYRIEGKDETNEIYIEMAADQLFQALKSAQTAQVVKIKLTKKHVPCLTTEIVVPSLASRSRSITHDIPVGIVPQRLWSEYQEPTMLPHDVSICLPHLRLLKSVVERLKNMDSCLILAANGKGSLTLQVETDVVSVTTHFKDLENPVVEGSEGNGQTVGRQDAEQSVEVRLDIKRFLQFIAAQQGTPEKVICNFAGRRGVQLFVLLDNVHIQYFLPGVMR